MLPPCIVIPHPFKLRTRSKFSKESELYFSELINSFINACRCWQCTMIPNQQCHICTSCKSAICLMLSRCAPQVLLLLFRNQEAHLCRCLEQFYLSKKAWMKMNAMQIFSHILSLLSLLRMVTALWIISKILMGNMNGIFTSWASLLSSATGKRINGSEGKVTGTNAVSGTQSSTLFWGCGDQFEHCIFMRCKVLIHQAPFQKISLIFFMWIGTV